MPPRIEPELRTSIIRLRLRGYGRNEIWRQLRGSRATLSPASVGNVLGEFMDFAREKGSRQAAKEFGLESVEIDELLAIADYARKNGVAPPEMGQGARIAKNINSLAVDPPTVETFAGEIAGAVRNGRVKDGKKFIDNCLELDRLAKKYNLDYDKLLQKNNELGTDLEKKEKREKDLDDEIKAKTDQLSGLKKKYDIDENRGKEYDATKKQLLNLGLDAESLTKYGKFLTNVAELNYDPKKAIGSLNVVDDIKKLDATKSTVEGKVSEFEKRLESLDKDLEKANDVLKDAKEQFDAKKGRD